MMENEIKSGKILKPGEVAQLLRVHVRTINRWSKKGELPHVKIGGRARYNEAEILNLLNSKNNG